MPKRLFVGDAAFGMALAFLVGVFLANLSWGLGAVVTVAFGGLVLLLSWCKSLWREGLLFICALSSGLFYFHYFINRQRLQTDLPLEQPVSFQALITDEPQPIEGFLILRARAEPPFRGNIKIFVPLGSDVDYGELLEVRGQIQQGRKVGEEPAVFTPVFRVLAEHRGFSLREWLLKLKAAILGIYNAVLPRDQAALLGGIAFGSRVSFRPELKSAMALSGLTHLVAVSGYNITIVIFAAGSTFGRFASKRTTFYLATLLLVLFMLMVGSAASGVRAALMGFLALIAHEAGKLFSMRNAITFTAAGMALFDPTVLTGSMSFVLSFLSLLGIVYVNPALQKLLGQTEGGFLDWKANAVTTLSAQLAVLPVLIRVFGQSSASSLLANILVLSTIPLTMFFGLLLALIGFIALPLAFFLGKLVGFILAYQLAVIQLFARWAVPLPLAFNADLELGFYYILLGAFALHYSRHEFSPQI